MTWADRPWTDGCQRNEEIDENGRRRQKGLFNEFTYNMPSDDCQIAGLGGRVIVPGAGSIYYTPGETNGGWPNFSESSSFFNFGAWGIDVNGDDGVTDANWRDYTVNGRQLYANIFPEISRYSVMAYGEYTLDGDMNATPYFELLYGENRAHNIGREFPIFQVVPANNPFNLCNPDAVNGTDCGLALDALYQQPNYIDAFRSAILENNPDCFGAGYDNCTPENFGFLGGATGAVTSQPVVYISGDRNKVKTNIGSLRAVAGVSGDLPFMNVGTLTNWTFDVSLAYTMSTGESARAGIREDRLLLGLGEFSTTNTPCENDTGEELAVDAAPGCVPVNLFADSLMAPIIGDFETPEERAYLFDSRDFVTDYEQTSLSAYMTGNAFDLPAGTVAVGGGIEIRHDKIDSIPDAVARDGLFWGFFVDGGAVGDKLTQRRSRKWNCPCWPTRSRRTN